MHARTIDCRQDCSLLSRYMLSVCLLSLPRPEGEWYHTAGQYLGAFSAEVEQASFISVHSPGLKLEIHLGFPGISYVVNMFVELSRAVRLNEKKEMDKLHALRTYTV
jgi:hypothetical protein